MTLYLVRVFKFNSCTPGMSSVKIHVSIQCQAGLCWLTKRSATAVWRGQRRRFIMSRTQDVHNGERWEGRKTSSSRACTDFFKIRSQINGLNQIERPEPTSKTEATVRPTSFVGIFPLSWVKVSPGGPRQTAAVLCWLQWRGAPPAAGERGRTDGEEIKIYFAAAAAAVIIKSPQMNIAAAAAVTATSVCLSPSASSPSRRRRQRFNALSSVCPFFKFRDKLAF